MKTEPRPLQYPSDTENVKPDLDHPAAKTNFDDERYESESIGSRSIGSQDDPNHRISLDCLKEEKQIVLETIQSIGAVDDTGRFIPKPGCMDQLQEIWRILLNVSSKDRTRLHLGNYAAMQNAFIPLFVGEYCSQDLFIVLLSIMALMMKPVESGCWLTFNQTHFLQVYKQALITSNVFAIIMDRMQDTIAKDTADRTPEDRMLLLTMIVFFKRVLAVPDDQPSGKSANNVFESLHDRCILVFKKDNVLDCIRYLAETEISRPCYADKIDPDKNLMLALLGCIYYIVEKESPESLLVSDDRSGAAVQRLLEVERNRTTSLQNRASRHSRFGGVVKVAAVGGTRFQSTLERSKPSFIHPNQLIIRNRRVYLSDDVRKALLDFTSGLYSSGFNAFAFQLFEEKWVQTSIHNEIMPAEMRQLIPQFYNVLAFFLSFNRVAQAQFTESECKFSLDNVAVCFEFDYLDDACKFVIRSAANIDWDVIESSVRFYKELLRNICEYSDKGDRDHAAELVLQVNYQQECRFSFPNLLKRYNPKNVSKRISHLLIETSYFQLKALDRTSDVVCDRKPKKRRRRKPVDVDDEEEDSISDDDFEFNRDIEVTSWLQKCIHPQIIANIMQVVKDYKMNDDSLNKFAITVLHKITFGQSFVPMVFRVPFFIVFHEILSDVSIRRNPAFRELRDFSKFAVREFFKTAQTHRSLLVDALFPITRRICEEITDSCDAAGNFNNPQVVPEPDMIQPEADVAAGSANVRAESGSDARASRADSESGTVHTDSDGSDAETPRIASNIRAPRVDPESGASKSDALNRSDSAASKSGSDAESPEPGSDNGTTQAN